MITLDAVNAWFAARGWQVSEVQRATWSAYARGRSGLVHAPTGTGKTLAAWVGPLLEAQGADDPLRVLWITPMRALAHDTSHSLVTFTRAMDVPWEVDTRTGDTAASVRARQRRRLPQALVTTPESASLLLSYADLLPQWRGLRAVVVDEWHELMGTKRGVQTELVLARLRGLAPGLRTWGLSATLGNLEEARAVLLGPHLDGDLIGAGATKRIVIDTLIPAAIERFPWAGHMGIAQLEAVIGAIEQASTTLAFTNTRSQAERWFQAIRGARPDLAVGLHHGSIEATLRLATEAALREGRMRAVVATSSLDLGVDFAPVDQVIQIGGPKGLARLLQRAGRSGHRPGLDSRVVCVPTHALELAEFAAARRAMAERQIEQRRPLRACLDVLAQHIVTLALTESVSAEEVLAQARATHAFAELGEREWRWVFDFVTRGGSVLAAYPQFHKVVERGGRLAVEQATIARRHRLSIGTITSDSSMRVRYLNGPALGTVEEGFIARLRPGDSFLFAGRALTLVRVREMTAFVRAGRSRHLIPRWQGGKSPLSSQLSRTLLELMQQAAEGHLEEPEMIALGPLLALQAQWSRIPRPDRLLVERTRSREGHHLFVYAFGGRYVHEGISALLAHRLSRRQPLTATLTPNDYGFEMLAPLLPEVDESMLREALSLADLEPDLLVSLNAAEMAKRRFREVARVAGLVFEGYPSAGKSVRQVQMSSGLIYDVFRRYDADNLLAAQALREVMDHQLEFSRLRETLARLQSLPIDIVDIPRLTPLAFPLWADRIGHRLSTEDWHTRIGRMTRQLENAAAVTRRPGISTKATPLTP